MKYKEPWYYHNKGLMGKSEYPRGEMGYWRDYEAKIFPLV